jgi:hypothetical protein
LPDEVLELPSIFHPSKANEFSEFSKNCWKMSGKVCSKYYKKEIFEIHRKTYRFSKNTYFWRKKIAENVFHLIFLQLWKTDILRHKARLYNKYFAKNQMKIELEESNKLLM